MNKINECGIELSNGIKVETHHEQDCCESVYADWGALKDTVFVDEEFNDVVIEKLSGSGFRINGYFVPCYNQQNGYYSSELILTITYPNGTCKMIDITDCNYDDIQ